MSNLRLLSPSQLLVAHEHGRLCAPGSAPHITRRTRHQLGCPISHDGESALRRIPRTAESLFRVMQRLRNGSKPAALYFTKWKAVSVRGVHAGFAERKEFPSQLEHKAAGKLNLPWAAKRMLDNADFLAGERERFPNIEIRRRRTKSVVHADVVIRGIEAWRVG